VRADRAVVAARHAERRKKARERGAKPSRDGMVRDGWHLMLTNLEAARATVKQLVAVYRARWAVEIQFRAWKQALNLGKSLNRRSNEDHLQALVLAGMIAHQLGMRIATRLGKLVTNGRLSYERLYHLLATHFVKARSLAETYAFTPDWRHVARDKRTRQSPVESGINALA
jgi:SRSO17 transposase